MSAPLPLEGLRVIEFTHMVMGPTCGMILGDLGAEVIKVEPLAGDNTRKLLGSGAGFFPMFNRSSSPSRWRLFFFFLFSVQLLQLRRGHRPVEHCPYLLRPGVSHFCFPNHFLSSLKI